MIKKLLLSILIFFVAYILLIFNLPIVAGAIEKMLGIKGFNEYISSFKSTYDKAVTNIPTQDELNNAYNTVQSGALELKKNLDIGVDYTKEKIDGYRETLSGAEDKFNEINNGYNTTKEYINTNSGAIDGIQDSIEKFSDITGEYTGTGEVN